MKMKNDAKIEEELAYQFKINMRNLTNFDPTLKNLKICILIGCFWPKYTMFELKKKIEELFLMALNTDAKFEGKITFAFKNNMKNLANFHQSTFES